MRQLASELATVLTPAAAVTSQRRPSPSLYFSYLIIYYRMDVTTSLKSLLLAVRQYRDSRTAQHAAQLQRQVEVSRMFCLQCWECPL